MNKQSLQYIKNVNANINFIQNDIYKLGKSIDDTAVIQE